jgi:hypothetical protein
MVGSNGVMTTTEVDLWTQKVSECLERLVKGTFIWTLPLVAAGVSLEELRKARFLVLR